MNALIIALLLAPLPAYSGVPCLQEPAERKAPCTASQGEKDLIMESVNEGMNAYEAYVPARSPKMPVPGDQARAGAVSRPPATLAGRSLTFATRPPAMISTRSTTCSSSRMFPGQR